MAGLVPATPISFTLCVESRGRRDKPGDDARIRLKTNEIRSNTKANTMPVRLQRVTLIIGLCCTCLACAIAVETVFIVSSILGVAKLALVSYLFVQVVFVLIINRNSFSYIILLLYLLAGAEVTREAWLMHVGSPLRYPKSLTPTQDLMFLFSLACFVVYLVAALFRTLMNAEE